jgi:hypothetical protein
MDFKKKKKKKITTRNIIDVGNPIHHVQLGQVSEVTVANQDVWIAALGTHETNCPGRKERMSVFKLRRNYNRVLVSVPV